ncbi:hypothetical protein [Arthrobacter cupressi]
MSEEATSGDRRGVPPEDEERGRYTEGNYGDGGAVASEDGDAAQGENDYTAAEYPEDREESARESNPGNEPVGEDPDLAPRAPDE